MLKNKTNLFIVLLISIMGLLSSCTYNWIEYPIPPPIDTTVVISFNQQIEPIFNNGSLCISCHKSGGTAPNLETGKAYTSITNSALVSLSDPPTSIIYDVPNPANTSDHTWKKYTAEQAQLVLTWIKQGALNN